jgi:DNA-binding PadR family transcriptional regulator
LYYISECSKNGIVKGERLGEFEELVLLSVCALGESASGASIQRTLEIEVGRKASLGALYAALDRMARKGFVASWLGEPRSQRGGRARRYYRATAAGRAALEELRAARALLWRRVTAANRR